MVRGRGYTHAMRDELHNDDEGRYSVITATGSRYELDLTARTLRRQMTGTPPIIDSLEAGFPRIRRYRRQPRGPLPVPQGR